MSLTLLYFHLLAASIWVGGMFFFALINVPVLKKELSQYEFSKKMELIGRRFQVAGWMLMAALLITGIGNLMLRLERDTNLPADYSSVLTAKILLFAVMVLNTAVHTFYLGPKMSALRNRIESGADDYEEQQESLRIRSVVSSALNMLLALIIMLLGVILSN